jgi:hypothetical protein
LLLAHLCYSVHGSKTAETLAHDESSGVELTLERVSRIFDFMIRM